MKARTFVSPPCTESFPPARWTRRRFLRIAGSASIVAPFLFSCRAQGSGPRVISPNEKLNHACIGVGGMGWNDFQNFLSHPRVQVVALCDVDSNNLEKAARAVPGARVYA